MKIWAWPGVVCLLSTLLLPSAVIVSHRQEPQVFNPPPTVRGRQEDDAKAQPPLPEDLVVDIRLFEMRGENPDEAAIRRLSFAIATDGRGVSANQWLATMSGRAPGTFLAALAQETVRVTDRTARFQWANRSRGFDVEVGLDGFHPSEPFKARVRTAWTRRQQVQREFTREIDLMMGQSSVWSGEELEVPVTDYLSYFRDYRDMEHRELLYRRLRSSTIYLILVATPRSVSEEESQQLSPEILTVSPEALPDLDNPIGCPLHGTIVVCFELDVSGRPLNPQIVRSTLPEANPRLLGQVASWRFPSQGAGGRRRWARVELNLEIPWPSLGAEPRMPFAVEP